MLHLRLTEVQSRCKISPSRIANEITIRSKEDARPVVHVRSRVKIECRWVGAALSDTCCAKTVCVKSKVVKDQIQCV